MTLTTAELARDVAAVLALEGVDVAGLDRSRLLAAQQEIARVRRGADVLLAQVSGEIARRSAVDAGPGGFARREGYASPQQLIADKLGVSTGEAGRLMEVGRVLAPRTTPDGSSSDAAEPARPHLAEAVRAGRLSVEKASIVGRCLDRVDGETDGLERELVRHAERLPVAHVRRMCEREWARRQPRDLEAREARQRAERTLSIHEDGGMTTIRALLDPVSAAPVRAWFDAQVKAAFQRRREVPGDERDAGQIRVDALVTLAEHGLDCDNPGSGVKTTVMLRMSVEDLRAGLGIGACDSMTGPISVPTLRRMAVDARVIPVVLGGDSMPLDMGRAMRLFTEYQRLAILERDGGCARCLAPPSWTHTHHLEWWGRDGGRTDLGNGVALCVSCHHMIHDGGWGVEVRGGTVSFIPPAAVDRERRPVPGGLPSLVT